MVTSTAGKPKAGTAARFAYAAGFTGILANLFLIAMYVGLGLQAGGPEAQRPPRSAPQANCRVRRAILWDRSRSRA